MLARPREAEPERPGHGVSRAQDRDLRRLGVRDPVGGVGREVWEHGHTVPAALAGRREFTAVSNREKTVRMTFRPGFKFNRLITW